MPVDLELFRMYPQQPTRLSCHILWCCKPQKMSVCPSYATTAGTPIPCGPVNACPGETVQVSGCGECTGDQQIFLYNATGTEVMNNDDGCVAPDSISYCSVLAYTVPSDSACQDFSIGQSCFSDSCTGTVSYDVLPAPALGICPTYASDGTASKFCAPVYACPGDIVAINGCGGCTGDQVLVFYDEDGQEVDFNDDGCGENSLCSSFNYGVPPTSPCQNYTIGESCFGGGCSGNVTYNVETFVDATTCPPFSATQDDPVTCAPIYACSGDIMQFSGCDACVGDETFYLYNSVGSGVGTNDNGCGADSLCAAFSYTVPADTECQYYTLYQSCKTGVCSGNTTFTVGPPLTPNPSARPTAVPSHTPMPTNSAKSYIQFFSTDSCSGQPATQGAINDDQCVAANGGFLRLECDAASAAAAWTVAFYPTNTCTGTPLSTASGSGACTCTPFDGMNVYVNCAGVPSNCGGSSSSSDLSSGAVAGIVVGVVGFCGLSALAAAYFLGYFQASTVARHSGTAMMKMGEDTSSPMAYTDSPMQPYTDSPTAYTDAVTDNNNL